MFRSHVSIVSYIHIISIKRNMLTYTFFNTQESCLRSELQIYHDVSSLLADSTGLSKGY